MCQSFCLGTPVAVVLGQRSDGNLIPFQIYPITKSRFVAGLLRNLESGHRGNAFPLFYLLDVYLVA